MNWEEIARAAYEQYCKIKYPAIVPIPAWDHLSQRERVAWMAAVSEAVELFTRAATA